MIIWYDQKLCASSSALANLGQQPDETTASRASIPDTYEYLRMDEKPSFDKYITESERETNQSQELSSPADIERPRSALHTGDFREGTPENQRQGQSQSPLLGHGSNVQFPLLNSSPTTPWFNASVFSSLRTPSHIPEQRGPVGTRSRAPSIGSSYVLKAPTSPLVHQANNTDLDFSPRNDSMDISESQEKANRRRTLPPETFRFLQSSPPTDQTNFGARYPSGRRGQTFSYQPSPPRRTLTSAYSLQLASSVQAPALRARRPSLTSDAPAKGHAPMVGSYEESILRGRMSMNPSKPLDFTAQIGVLGRSKCKSGLKCPPHVSIPFPAVFYSYPTSGSGRSISDDNPSPYVGHIDLENALPRDDSGTNRRRKRHQSPIGNQNDPVGDDTVAPKYYDQEALRRREKRNRRAESPKCPPGGCYRIPQQGQLQIMIKNPNKTAVKLFLVPYDLSDMEPGTKTFIRQRSYSAGPIIDMPLSARKNYGTDRPEASLSVSEDPKDKPILRYLVHLNICCPSKGRYYLHSSIRVVFANRVPDGKEQLRNEIQHPDPKYTPYKPAREANSTSAGVKSASEKPYRRRSAGQNTVPNDESARDFAHDIPVSLQPKTTMGLDRADGLETVRHPFQSIPSEPTGPCTEAGLYNKLRRGDTGYGGYPSSSHSGPEAGESLLAKRLRGLEVQKHYSRDVN